MPKIAFIGAGSFNFTRGLVRDILTFPLLRDATIALMDINRERLDFAHRAVKKIIEAGNYPARMQVTTNRADALKGADAVLVTVLVGRTDVWKWDILIPNKYGVSTCVGDTRGPSGIFRALRTIPVMLDIIRDVERCCPNAVVLLRTYCRPQYYPYRPLLGEGPACIVSISWLSMGKNLYHEANASIPSIQFSFK